eukprot:COSAG02_NODE_7867_length_2811_cov_6.892440_6_plen_138_part_01
MHHRSCEAAAATVATIPLRRVDGSLFAKQWGVQKSTDRQWIGNGLEWMILDTAAAMPQYSGASPASSTVSKSLPHRPLIPAFLLSFGTMAALVSSLRLDVPVATVHSIATNRRRFGSVWLWPAGPQWPTLSPRRALSA